VSRADVRLILGAAISQVPGLTGHDKRPTAIRAGDAWPMWRGVTRLQGMFADQWEIGIALPGGEVEASAFVDTHGVEIEDALEACLYVTGMTPVEWTTDTGPSLGLLVTGVREQ
jgi:hypothetical protein